MNYSEALATFILSKKFLLSCENIGSKDLWPNKDEFRMLMSLLKEVSSDIFVEKSLISDILSHEYYVISAAIWSNKPSGQFVISSYDVEIGVTVTKWIWSYLECASPEKIRSQLSQAQIRWLNQLRLAIYTERSLDAGEDLEHHQICKILLPRSGNYSDDPTGLARELSVLDEDFRELEPNHMPLVGKEDETEPPKITPSLPGPANPQRLPPNPVHKPNRKPGRKDQGNEK